MKFKIIGHWPTAYRFTDHAILKRHKKNQNTFNSKQVTNRLVLFMLTLKN